MVRIVSCGVVVWLVVLAPCVAQEAAGQKFRVKLDSTLAMKRADGQTVETKTRYRLDYTHGPGAERFEVSLNRMAQQVSQNGTVVRDVELTRDAGRQGETTMPFEKAPIALQALLEDAFRNPLCVVEFDGDRRETKREVVAKPAALEFVKNGVLHQVLFFHAPFPAEGESWQAKRVFSLGSGDEAEGMLTYTRGAPSADGRVPVTVKGSLTGTQVVQGTVKATATYGLEGTQHYDPKLQRYVAGELQITIGMEVKNEGTVLAQGEGAATASLHLRDD